MMLMEMTGLRWLPPQQGSLCVSKQDATGNFCYWFSHAEVGAAGRPDKTYIGEE